ncbi:conserved oligomeric Golgi complex subunit 2-like [Teleopsis dalmanni]|uniref:conserved oligomeric Golgi complex subunit 2-like n=2 Tax=Teleopsis dalmanni TaxID=139649 RepID=UPI000D32B44C|nr:conserved oligomeric Golgi complex subunit 2-like [Teleopsis dalmanni]
MTENKITALISKNTAASGEELCFDKNEFMKATFSVDEFLHKNRTAPSLEQLRDNLGIYLKGLRAAMIDLINEDYADFVSLSANLNGLDIIIGALKKPLLQFREEVESILNTIKENESEIRSHLEMKKMLREQKRDLLSLRKVNETIQKLENLLANQLNSALRVVDLERAALDLIQLKFHNKYCMEVLHEEQKVKILQLEHDVLEKLRTFFNESLKNATSANAEQLERSLRIYITLDMCDVAEKVFRDDILAPYMNTTISEHYLQNSPHGLGGIYSKVLNFISLHMTDLLRLTQYTDKLHGFNFLVNSYWVDVASRIETHMMSIFAPGNAEIFYTKYKCTRDFISKIEELLSTPEAIEHFRQHKQTKSFQARWNLPVYFQICFQDIAGQFEAVLEPPLNNNNLTNADNERNSFRLLPFNKAYKAMLRCWADGLYLPEVFPKFYRLNIQIVVRLSRWISTVMPMITTNKVNELPAGFNKTDFLITLHDDIQKFTATLPQIQETISACIPKNKQTTLISETVAKSIVLLQSTISVHLTNVQDALVNILIAESGLENVRQVNDLPRLYRKTNRDIPTRSSGYVEQMIRPLKQFATKYGQQLGNDTVNVVLGKVVKKITADYYLAVSDVLTSVQKTEESLKRLRNLKSNISQGAGPTSVTNAMTDDDKIRLQLRVDVIGWTAELALLHFEPTDVEKLLELNNIVEESIKLKEVNNF